MQDAHDRIGLGGTIIALLVGLVAGAPTAAHAVSRTCGVDPVANTATVLCAAPSGPCTSTLVTMSTDIDVTAGGCEFDLGGRALNVQKSFQMIGTGFIRVANAGNITVTGTGRLKARGDFVMPSGSIIRGGQIWLTSNGTITLLDRAQIDVSGDGAGSIRLVAAGANAAGVGVDMQATAQVMGNGITSLSSGDEGERFADGGSLFINATGGGILSKATISMKGANQAQGGAVDFRSARDITINETIDASGGGSDGGSIDLAAADNIVTTKSLSVDSRVGGGYGGTMTFIAGADSLGGVIVGGGITIDDTTLELNGSDAETFGGDGGELDMGADGPVQFLGTHAGIHANAGTLWDGFGGLIGIESGDSAFSTITAKDGDLTIQGTVVARSGGTSGDGGVFEFSAGRNFTLTASIDVSGKDTGGDFDGDAGGSILLNGLVSADATNTTGEGGFVDVISGLAQNAGLTVAKNITATGGTSNGGGQSMSFAGCTVTINSNIKVDGHGGTSAIGTLGGADVEIVARGLMNLQNNSQYLAFPGGSIRTTHLPSQAPVIGSGVVFNPARIDNSTTIAAYPNCPVCGDGVRQLGEGCDDHNLTAGDGCSVTCTVESGWSCSGEPSVCATVCGDGIRLPGEECDDGNLVSGDGCDNNCTTSRCGNGAIGGSEQCDDHNTAGGDGCSATCQIESGYACSGEPSVCARTCGDGFTTGSEECDDGNFVSGDGCDANCTLTRCGNGIITAGEQCEDGNTQSGDCCSATCQFEASGSGCQTDGNLCTDDVCNGAGLCQHPNNTAPCNDGNLCTANDACLLGSCHAGPALNCNDGNVCTDDSCVPATGCVHAPNTLPCDDGEFCTVNDRCNATTCDGQPRDCADTNGCTFDSCDETANQCVHDPVPVNGTTCNDNLFCTVNDACQGGACVGAARDCSASGNQCNDGVCNETTDHCVSQTKPNGSSCNDGQVCTVQDVCTNGTCGGNPMTCGDGTLQSACSESCDDGNLISGDGCDANCTPTGCGNGILTTGEACDDHDLADGDGCSASCTVEPGWTCSGAPSVCSEICGDGVKTPGEQCDDGNLADRDGCSSTCRFELCTLTPATVCRRPLVSQKASLLLKKPPFGEQVLAWKWIKGAQTSKPDFGNPLFSAGTAYAICIYDESGPTPQLKLSATAPAGGFCVNKSCWRDKSSGYTYADKDATPHGLTGVILKEGLDTLAKITVKGKGSRLQLPDLTSLHQPLRVQLRNGNGLCWETVFSAPATKQTAEQFKDKAD